MIIKGGSRAAPDQLGRHLLRTDTNERVQILELQSPTGSLTEALRDWQFLATGTRGHKGLYHANIDPDTRYSMTPEQWRRSVEVLEEKLGFQGQPRAVVLHEKHGRQHIHVVWQRTDIESMTLRPDSHNYRKHEEASLALEQEFGHEHVPGKHAKRDRQKQPEPPKAQFNHAAWQQAERAAVDPRDLKETITTLYEQSDNCMAFKAALEENGYVLARGDRRDFVIVDRGGQIHSLGRQIGGVSAKDLQAFMSDIERNKLPSVEDAKTAQRQTETPKPPRPAPHPEPLTPAEITVLEKALAERQQQELAHLSERQDTERQRTSDAISREIHDKLDHFDAVQRAQRARHARETSGQHTGLNAMIEAIRDFLRPNIAAEEQRQREETAEAFAHKLESERAEFIGRLNAEKQRDLEALDERHAQQRREHEAQRGQELERYIKDREAAKRLAAELEEERRLNARRSRDGPDRAR